MSSTVITPDALELILRLNETTRDLLLAVKVLQAELEDLKLQTVKSPLLTLKEAAEFIKMSPQYISQGPTGKGTPPPNVITIFGPKGDGEKPRLFCEVEECRRWIAKAPRRYSDESQERRWREHGA